MMIWTMSHETHRSLLTESLTSFIMRKYKNRNKKNKNNKNKNELHLFNKKKNKATSKQ